MNGTWDIRRQSIHWKFNPRVLVQNDSLFSDCDCDYSTAGSTTRGGLAWYHRLQDYSRVDIGWRVGSMPPQLLSVWGRAKWSYIPRHLPRESCFSRNTTLYSITLLSPRLSCARRYYVNGIYFRCSIQNTIYVGHIIGPKIFNKCHPKKFFWTV